MEEIAQTPDFWTFSIWNCENINFCLAPSFDCGIGYSSPGTLSQQCPLSLVQSHA